MAAGSTFAVLQSLGATGLGILLFGSIGAGLGLLTSSAAALGWCTCESDAKSEEPVNNSIEQTVKGTDQVKAEESTTEKEKNVYEGNVINNEGTKKE